MHSCLEHNWEADSRPFILFLVDDFTFSNHDFSMARQPLVGQSLLIVEASRSHSDTWPSVGLNEWSARRRDLYPTTTNPHKRYTDMPPRDSNPQFQQASGHRPRGHSDRHLWISTSAHCSYSQCSRSSNAALTSLYNFCHIELSFGLKL